MTTMGKSRKGAHTPNKPLAKKKPNVYGRGSISCQGHDNLETERIQPNSPPLECLSDDDVACVAYMHRKILK